MSLAVRVLADPAFPNNRLVLWAVGHMSKIGTQQAPGFIDRLAPRSGTPSFNSSAPTFNQELDSSVYGASGEAPVIGFQVKNFAEPSGYTFDQWQNIYRWGVSASVPLTTPMSSRYSTKDTADIIIDPAGGAGYVLRTNGDLIAFGGATAVAHGAFLPGNTYGGIVARRVIMDWTSKRYWVVDSVGRVWGKNGGNDASVGGLTALAVVPNWTLRRSRGFYLYDTSTANPKGWLMTDRGEILAVGSGVQTVFGNKTSASSAIFTDFTVIDTGTGANPMRMLQLMETGEMWEFVVSSPPNVTLLEPTDPQTDVTRPFVTWAYADAENHPQSVWEYALLTDAVYQAGATTEVQRITITGSPTGGTFTVTFRGVDSDPIAYNANAATVQAALEAMTSIGSGNVVCTGGALPGSFVTCTFASHLAYADLDQMTAVGAFTGGSSPAVAVTTQTAGVGVDPAIATAVERQSGAGATTRGTQVGLDIPSDVYRAYVRAKDSTGLWSAWRWAQWTHTHTPPATPSIGAITPNGVGSVSITVSVNPSGLSADARFAVQFHDADWDGENWSWVKSGYNIDPDGSGLGAISDHEIRFNTPRTYRTMVYIYNEISGLWSAGPWSAEVTYTYETRGDWVLSSPEFPVLDRLVHVDADRTLSREQVGGVFYPVGRPDPIIVLDGTPRAPEFKLDLWVLSKADRLDVDAIFASQTTMLLRDPFGNAHYFRIVGSIEWKLIKAQPMLNEATALRDANHVSAPCFTVRRPLSGMPTGPLADTV